jgi:sugar O-acyltransferase (sialic acid O-acetyltransferase NeuD family)
MTQPLIILGTGGSAFDVLDVIEAINAQAPRWEVAGFLDDSRSQGSRYLGFDVLGRLSDALRFSDHFFINVIGSDQSYRRRPEILASTGLTADRFATLVHPTATVSSRAQLGRGVYVNHGVSVGGGVRVGDQVCLGPGCIVGHETVIEAFTLLAPGAIVSGRVHIGNACYVGAGAMVRQNLHVGEQALIGMGAVVLHDVAPGCIVVGNPARILRRPAVSPSPDLVADGMPVR